MPTWPTTKVVMLGKLNAAPYRVENPQFVPSPREDYFPTYTTPTAGQHVIRKIVMNGVSRGLGALGLGDDAAAAAAVAAPAATACSPMPMGVRAAYGALLTASAAASLYHGYKRHGGSLPWGLGWMVMGTLFPVITPTVAFAQGFGKRKGH